MENSKHSSDITSLWQVYIIRCVDGSLYTGVTKDVSLRIVRHNAGIGAKYTRGRRPVSLVYMETVNNKGTALRREHQIKQLGLVKKKKLISNWRHQNTTK